jgi:hypothetical protein
MPPPSRLPPAAPAAPPDPSPTAPSPHPRLWPAPALDAAAAAGRLSAWAAAAYAAFRAKVLDDAFPCTFGTVAQRRGEVLYAFVESAPAAPDAAPPPDADTPAEAGHVREALVAYADVLRPLDPVRAALLPLVVLLPPARGLATVDDYFARGWALLRWLRAHDPAPWPAHVPEDPDDPRWSFCFGGRQLFVTFKTPLHARRRSRHVDHAWAVLFQAREGFDALAGDTPHGRRARARIRAKLAAYDALPPSPALAHYGAPENREWRQYFAPEGDTPLAARCPFHAAVRPPSEHR